jgi:hypothetical protein
LDGVVGLAFWLPAGFVLAVVVAAADGVEIVGVGFAAVFPGDGVWASPEIVKGFVMPLPVGQR